MTRRWFWLIGPWAAFIALALGWTIYWHAVAGEAERRLRAVIADQQAQGASAILESVQRAGFPATLRLELRRLRYAPPRAGWSAETEALNIYVNLLNTQHITLRAPSPIAFRRSDGGVSVLDAETLIASFRSDRGVLARAAVEADALALDDPAQDGVLRARKIVLNIRPDPRGGSDYQVAFDAVDLSLPRPVRSFEGLGLAAPSLRAAMVVQHGAALLQGAQNDPLGPWRDAGGRVRFEALVLHWGALQTTGSGEGALDSERRLQGALHFPIEEPAAVLNAIAQGPDVNEDTRDALRLLATAFALSGEDVTLDAEASEGVLRLEGLSVRTLPPVY